MDNLYLGEIAREGMMRGIKKAAEAVGVTMGTAGRNSIIECVPQPGYYVTNDGFSILNSMQFADPLEELGRKQLLEAVNRANKSSGDGSSGACVLTAAILEEGMKHLEKANPMEIKRSLDACIPIIEKSIKKQAKPITLSEVHQVASISAEDEGIGKMVGEIYKKIGKEGIVQWEAAKVPEDSYEIGKGIKIEDAGFFTPYLCDIDASTGFYKPEMKLKDVPVILCPAKIQDITAFDGIFQTLNDEGHSDVAIFCDEVRPEAVASILATRAAKGFRVALIRMPVLWRDEWWEDLAIASGATIISPATGVSLNNLTREHLGHFDNLTVKKDHAIIDGTKDMKKHLLALAVDGSDEAKQRLARLQLKTARYFVGGYSESGLAYRRLKVEDAINAASEALDGGVVAGGGVALLDVIKDLDALKTPGSEILSKALMAPLNQIAKNAGIKTDGKIIGQGKGIDSRTGKIVDMISAGIVDPAKVILSEVRSAIGVASGVLTLGTVVLLPPPEPQTQRESLIRR